MVKCWGCGKRTRARQRLEIWVATEVQDSTGFGRIIEEVVAEELRNVCDDFCLQAALGVYPETVRVANQTLYEQHEQKKQQQERALDAES